jgi:hypothetical protein
MCKRHGDSFQNLRTGRCVVCTSRHYVPVMPQPQAVEQEKKDSDETKEVRYADWH